MKKGNPKLRVSGGVVVLLAHLFPFAGIADDEFDAPPIEYGKAVPNNAVSRLQAAIDNGTAALGYEPGIGYVKSLLDAFSIPVESQVLVFSKTSLQIQFISPANPRSIYFNDDVYIGRVPGGEVVEISATDPDLGTVFYTLVQERSERPQFVRQRDMCLQCHGSVLTGGVPGHIVRSVFTAADGYPILKAGSFVTTQASPWEERWGGWYVTGQHGNMRHMGNVIATETERDATVNMEAGANRLTLDNRTVLEEQLVPHSDIVALLVLEHQTRMHNLLTEANFQTRIALARQAEVDKILNRDPAALSETTQHIIKGIGDRLVDYMVFAGEAPMASPVSGTSGFADVFARLGPRDAEGRSLRDFDLQTRLFKFPLSYLIYSQQFDALPDAMKDYVYARLWGVLTGVVFSKNHVHLGPDTRKAIREIVVQTKPGLPGYWKET
ncbi:MAG: hypothetical protein HUU46_15655 [Candidatus Hydrogenedentes bacterium]|nr:hypothetical protein [Candidatus Hydrogenedentota bacterium]